MGTSSSTPPTTWLTLAHQNEAGSVYLDYAVSPNRTGAPRVGHISFGHVRFVVTQTADGNPDGPPDDPLPGEPVAGTASYYHSDAIGSVRLITDQNQQVVSRHDYLPFGEEWSPPASSAERRRFTGKERDKETSFDYSGARYYQSQTGRFTTPDAPVFGNPADPQSWNLYAYARNNPLRYTDPDGHCAVDGEEHGWLWCAGHALGLTQTATEQEAIIGQQRAWLSQNVAINPDQRSVLAAASSSEITRLYGQWNSAIVAAQFNAGQEVAYGADAFRRSEAGALVLFRGGSSLTPRLNVDVKVDKTTGLLKEGGGISLNSDPGLLQRFGGAYQVMSVPPDSTRPQSSSARKARTLSDRACTSDDA